MKIKFIKDFMATQSDVAKYLTKLDRTMAMI